MTRSNLAIKAFFVAASLLVLAACTPDADQDTEQPDSGLWQDVIDDAGDADETSNPDANGEDDPWQTLPEKPWPSTETGPFEVAYRYDHVTYQPRGDNEEPRSFDLSIWYPTFEDDGDSARYFGLINRFGVWEDADPALREPAPIMLFSHGNSALSVQSYFWTEFLASHGWIVLAPDHTGNTFVDTEGAINLGSAVYRPQDLSAALDYLIDLPADDPLHGWASDDVAVSGHSFGGTTSLSIAGSSFPVDELLAQCESGELSDRYCDLISEEHAELFRERFLDPRISAAIPQSPGGGSILAEGVAEIEIPILLWTARDDGMTSNEEDGDPIWEGLNGVDDVRIDVAQAAHFTFSNMCDYFSSIDDIANEGCGEEFMSPQEIHPIHNTYSLEFLRLHLFGDQEAASWFGPDHEPLHENLEFSFK